MHYYGFLAELLTVEIMNQNLINMSFPAKKAVEESEEKKTVQPKKKIKELRILDGKTAQNLCKWY